jgi:hypothetical protein
MVAVFTPYTTASSLFGTKPSWIPSELDQQRIQSYLLYEQIYWNVPDIFKVSLRGSNDAPIYIPSGRTIVDTTNRYTAPAFNVIVRDRVTGASGESQDTLAARMAISDLMARERFRSKFSGAKRYGLIRGDWVWHITADPTKALGSRISIVALDPGMYFKISDPEDIDTVVGCHLAQQVTDANGDPAIRRLTYRKDSTNPEEPTVTVEEGLFPVDNWESDTAKPSTVIRPVTQLVGIRSLPVYHVKNFEEPGNPFGSSELRGLERLMAAVNQVMSDEDLTLAIEGIGVYATDAPQPIDPVTKAPTNWKLGPGRVAHRPPGSKFERINGATSVGAYGDHFGRLVAAMREAASTPDIAVGQVDVQVASSGIALALQLGPMLAKAGEKNELIIDVHNQMWFDIVNQWMPVYEETQFVDVAVTCVVGDAIPVDRVARLTELNDMLDRGVIDTEFYRQEASKLGYESPEGIGDRALAEKQSLDPLAVANNLPPPAGG